METRSVWSVWLKARARLRHFLSEEEIGISDLRRTAERILGDRTLSWFWSYRIQIGVK
jgi:hypothetical protein